MTAVPLSDSTGVVIRHAEFASRHITPRHVEVWLPPGYRESAAAYPVIYMHDGQNLFDPALASYGVDWGVDEALICLADEGGVPGAIVVGVWNTPARLQEYMPQKPLAAPEGRALLERFAQGVGGAPISDQYLRFLTEELKPFVDATYRTLRERQHTYVMGSSMGGLVSLYALVEYPDIFGGAGCVSTHWPIGGDTLLTWFGTALPRAGRHRLYFDYGTEGLDTDYEPLQRRMDVHVAAAGYRAGADWRTEKFEGADHNEQAWRARVHIPLAFLLGR